MTAPMEPSGSETSDRSPAAQLARARWALGHNAIGVHYQPQVRLSDGELVGLEVLLRWRSADGVIREPTLLKHAFTRLVLASKLGAAVRQLALRQLASWQAAGVPVVPLAINVAPVELQRPDFAAALLASLEQQSITPDLIEIEITEQAWADEGLEVAVGTVATLRAAGVSVAIDDFGAGHSALSRLVDFPIDTLKIDHFFVAKLGAQPRSETVIKGILEMARGLGCRVIAEGIEEPGQREILGRLGCEYGQGYLLGRPLDGAATEVLLGANRG